jgi:hypothetical protein
MTEVDDGLALSRLSSFSPSVESRSSSWIHLIYSSTHQLRCSLEAPISRLPSLSNGIGTSGKQRPPPHP